MTLVRRNTNNFDRFFLTAPSIFDSMLDDLLWSPPGRKTSDEVVNTVELDDCTEICIAAPGIEKGDFNISLKESVITISYDQSTEENPRIFSKNAFSKSWTLPEGTRSKDVSAKYDAGILTVSIKKGKKIQPKTHSINIA
jgi:HSP20 family protein